MLDLGDRHRPLPRASDLHSGGAEHVLARGEAHLVQPGKRPIYSVSKVETRQEISRLFKHQRSNG